MVNIKVYFKKGRTLMRLVSPVMFQVPGATDRANVSNGAAQPQHHKQALAAKDSVHFGADDNLSSAELAAKIAATEERRVANLASGGDAAEVMWLNTIG